MAANSNASVRVARRAWVPRHQAEELLGRCAAVLGTSADDTVIASITAARLHGLWVPESANERIHVATVTPNRAGRLMTRSQRPELVAHRFQLRPEDTVTVAGLLVTSLARTWRDLASVLSLPDLVAAGDSALRSGASVDELGDAIASSSRRHNARRAHQAFGLLDARSRSRPESHLRVAVSGPDMPRFEVNVSIFRCEGGWLAEPDLSLEEAMLALEYQGEDHGNPERMRKDITRFTDMRRNEWLTLPYGPAEVFGRPYLIKPEVRELIRVRAPHLLRPSR
ncbi:MAG TPA: hypothetical protein VGH43_12985 [Jatrophihabitans sp.]|jgi:hypothetical protein